MADDTHIEEIEEQAALFALGALPAEEAARFEQRLASGCPVCLAEFQEFERVVTSLPLSVPDMRPDPALRAKLLKRIAEDDGVDVKGVIVRAGDTEWQPSPVPGVQMRSLLDKKTMLVRMAPNTWYPAHDHPAGEQCLVLEGSLSTEGMTAYAGDFTYMPAGSVHEPLYSESGCLLLIAYT
jgi:Anti-sigma factor